MATLNAAAAHMLSMLDAVAVYGRQGRAAVMQALRAWDTTSDGGAPPPRRGPMPLAHRLLLDSAHDDVTACVALYDAVAGWCDGAVRMVVSPGDATILEHAATLQLLGDVLRMRCVAAACLEAVMVRVRWCSLLLPRWDGARWAPSPLRVPTLVLSRWLGAATLPVHASATPRMANRKVVTEPAPVASGGGGGDVPREGGEVDTRRSAPTPPAGTWWQRARAAALARPWLTTAVGAVVAAGVAIMLASRLAGSLGSDARSLLHAAEEELAEHLANAALFDGAWAATRSGMARPDDLLGITVGTMMVARSPEMMAARQAWLTRQRDLMASLLRQREALAAATGAAAGVGVFVAEQVATARLRAAAAHISMADGRLATTCGTAAAGALAAVRQGLGDDGHVADGTSLDRVIHALHTTLHHSLELVAFLRHLTTAAVAHVLDGGGGSGEMDDADGGVGGEEGAAEGGGDSCTRDWPVVEVMERLLAARGYGAAPPNPQSTFLIDWGMDGDGEHIAAPHATLGMVLPPSSIPQSAHACLDLSLCLQAHVLAAGDEGSGGTWRERYVRDLDRGDRGGEGWVDDGCLPLLADGAGGGDGRRPPGGEVGLLSVLAGTSGKPPLRHRRPSLYGAVPPSFFVGTGCAVCWHAPDPTMPFLATARMLPPAHARHVGGHGGVVGAGSGDEEWALDVLDNVCGRQHLVCAHCAAAYFVRHNGDAPARVGHNLHGTMVAGHGTGGALSHAWDAMQLTLARVRTVVWGGSQSHPLHAGGLARSGGVGDATLAHDALTPVAHALMQSPWKCFLCKARNAVRPVMVASPVALVAKA